MGHKKPHRRHLPNVHKRKNRTTWRCETQARHLDSVRRRTAIASACVPGEHRAAVPSGVAVANRRRPRSRSLCRVGDGDRNLVAGDVVAVAPCGWSRPGHRRESERMFDPGRVGGPCRGLYLGFARELESGGRKREGRARLYTALQPVAQSRRVLLVCRDVNEGMRVLDSSRELTDVGEVFERRCGRQPRRLRHSRLPVPAAAEQQQQQVQKKSAEERAKPHGEACTLVLHSAQAPLSCAL